MPFFYVCNPVISKKSIVFVFSVTCNRSGLFGPQCILRSCPCETITNLATTWQGPPSWKFAKLVEGTKYTFLACILYFPNTGYVIIL